MAIARKPAAKSAPEISEAEADRFIHGAGATTVPTPATPLPKRGRVATMVRFDADLLVKVDAAAKRRGVSRSAWIQYTLSEAVEDQP
jgi:hypothetical protein